MLRRGASPRKRPVPRLDFSPFTSLQFRPGRWRKHKLQHLHEYFANGARILQACIADRTSCRLRLTPSRETRPPAPPAGGSTRRGRRRRLPIHRLQPPKLPLHPSKHPVAFVQSPAPFSSHRMLACPSLRADLRHLRPPPKPLPPRRPPSQRLHRNQVVVLLLQLPPQQSRAPPKAPAAQRRTLLRRRRLPLPVRRSRSAWDARISGS